MPSVQAIIARSALAYACAASRMTSAGTPVIRSPYSSVYGSTHSGEASHAVVDQSVVLQTGVNDLARHGVGERDVGAHVKTQPHVGPLRRARATRVNDV